MAKKQSKHDFQKWECWQRNLEQIKHELLYLDRSRKIFSKVWDIINQNSKLKKHLYGIYLNWLIHNYGLKLCMGIRRLVDRREKAPSIHNLLDDIEKNIQQINVDNLAKYIAQLKPETFKKDTQKYNAYKAYCPELALNAYEKAFGGRRKKLLLRDLKKDIGLVCNETKKIKDYVDKTWAHTDKNKDKFEIPKVLKAHDCLDSLIKIYTRYSLLVGGNEFKPYPDNILNDWDEPLRILWVE